jgi:ribosomal protein uS17
MPRRVLQGTVVSDANDKTVTVRVERRVAHPVYKKTIRRSKKYAAHDEKNQFKIGDGVNAWSDLSYFKNLEDLGGTLDDYVPLTQKGATNGVAPLDGSGKIPLGYLTNLIASAPEALDTLKELADAVTYVTNQVSGHNSTTTAVHGIADTALLATKAYADTVGTTEATSRGTAISTHNSATANVHGISDTSALATKTYADNAVSTHEADTTNVHGIADTSALATKSYVDTADALKAALASPAFTGTPTAPTATAGTNTTQVATTAFVGTAVSNLVASAPAALDTLNELAAALGSDANFSTTMTNALALKASIAQLDAAALASFNNKTTSYTAILTDEGNVIEMDSASANSVTIPPNSSVAFRIGSSIDVFQKGTGQTSIVAGAGVTVLNTPGLKFRDRYSMATLIKRDTNTWIVSGDLTA